MSDTQQSQVTLSLSKVVWHRKLLNFLMSPATEFLDRNHLCSSVIYRSVAELWLVSCLFTSLHVSCWFVWERWSNQQSTTDNYVVVCVTRSHVCLAIVCRWKIDSATVARFCCVSDMGLTIGRMVHSAHSLLPATSCIALFQHLHIVIYCWRSWICNI